MKSQNFLIAALSTSAVLLAALLIWAPATPEARADMTITSGGYTLIAHSTQPGGAAELVTVVDTQGQKLATFQLQNNGFKLIGGANLAKAFH